MRRSWLFAITAFAVVLAIPASAMAASADFTSGVASGDVTSSKAILWTRAVPTGSRPPNIKIEVWKEDVCLTGETTFKSKDKTTSAARDYTIKVDATGLEPGTSYCFRFRRGDEAFSDVGHFKTAPDPNEATDVHFTYSGDSDGIKIGGVPAYNNFDVLNQARQANGDFFAYNGDTIYSDSEVPATPPAQTLAEYRAKYLENRTYPNLTDLMASTSTYANMDDHEVVNDYDGQTVDPVRYAAGREAFLEYMPVRESGLPHDPTCAGDPLYRHVKWGADVEVFIPDLRSCRSADVQFNPCLGDLGPTLPPAVRSQFPFNLFLFPNPPAGCLAALFNPARTILGPVQKAQLKNDLLNSTAKFKYVINEYAIQQFHALPYDRWEGYGAERNEMLDFISNNAISNVVFLTTDHHATMQNQVFKDRFTAPSTIANDFVTGPIATNTLQTEILGQFGPLGFAAFNATLTVDGIDCKNLNKNSYGDVAYSAGSISSTVASKDDTGANVLDSNTSAPCVKTLP